MAPKEKFQIIAGTSLSKFIKITNKGLIFDLPWSGRIGEPGKGFRVASLLKKDSPLALVAMNFEPQAKEMIFFPGGAIIVVLEGKLAVGNRSKPRPDGNRTFRGPIYCLTAYQTKHIKPRTWTNIVADQATIFLLCTPGGFKFPG